MFRRRPVAMRRTGAPLLKTALAGGAGYMAGKSMTQKAGRGATQEQQQAAPPPASASSRSPSGSASDDTLARLKQLGDLRASGVLTEQEFEQEKQKVLRKSSTN